MKTSPFATTTSSARKPYEKTSQAAPSLEMCGKLLKTPSRHDYKERKSKGISGTSGTLGQEMASGYISSRAASPASPLAAPVSERDRQTTATSGLRCLGLFQSSSPVGLLQRMLLASLKWHSSKCRLTWKAKVTKSGVSLFQLAPSMRRTAATGAGLLPTAKSGERGEDYAKLERSKTGASLETQIALLPTVHSNPPHRKLKDGKSISAKGEEYGLSVHQVIEAQTGSATGAKLRLQPAFTEWMMGYPEGWLDFPAVEQSAAPDGEPKL
jgi:hypothetical protein